MYIIDTYGKKQLTISNLLFVFLGKPLAFASSFINDITNGIQNRPDFVLKPDNDKTFKTVTEPYPWLALDFEQPRLVKSVS